MKSGFFERCHLGETTLHATSLDLWSEGYESKTSKPLLENPCYYSSHRCVIDTFVNRDLTTKESHQEGRRKFLVFKNETTESSFFYQCVYLILKLAQWTGTTQTRTTLSLLFFF